MTKYPVLLFIIALRIIYHPSHIDTNPSAFANSLTIFSSKNVQSPLKFIQLKSEIRNNKVMLTWNINANETVEIFEVEKSTDGKNFTVAALVFGTDKTNIDQYMFYEKTVSFKVFYRIKLINKNKEIEYSKTVEINS